MIRYYAIDDDKKKNTPCFLLEGTSAAMIDFVNLYSELLKCKFHTEYTITTLDMKIAFKGFPCFLHSISFNTIAEYTQYSN